MNIQTTLGIADLKLPSVDELRQKFAPYLSQMEIDRQLPANLVECLSDLGVFRMLAPRQMGGLELDFPIALELIRRISAVDGSIGWIAAVNSGACLVLPKLPLAALGEVYKSGPDQIVAGSAQPQGIGRKVPGGWMVSGRWPYASGCTAASWLVAGFTDGDADPSQKNPDAKHMLLPASKYTIEDTWRVMGLRGTGSHHISIENAFVADDYVLTLGPGEPSVNAPLYRHPAHLIALGHGAVHIGIAQAAIEDLVGFQRSRSRDSAARQDLVRFKLGECQARLNAVRAVFDLQASRNWSDAVIDLPGDPNKLSLTMQTLVNVAAETLHVVRTCFELIGSAAIYEESPIQRRLRDIEVATQHGLVQREKWIAGGKALLDIEEGSPVTDTFFSSLANGRP